MNIDDMNVYLYEALGIYWSISIHFICVCFANVFTIFVFIKSGKANLIHVVTVLSEYLSQEEDLQIPCKYNFTLSARLLIIVRTTLDPVP